MSIAFFEFTFLLYLKSSGWVVEFSSALLAWWWKWKIPRDVHFLASLSFLPTSFHFFSNVYGNSSSVLVCVDVCKFAPQSNGRFIVCDAFGSVSSVWFEIHVSHIMISYMLSKSWYRQSCTGMCLQFWLDSNIFSLGIFKLRKVSSKSSGFYFMRYIFYFDLTLTSYFLESRNSIFLKSVV